MILQRTSVLRINKKKYALDERGFTLIEILIVIIIIAGIFAILAPGLFSKSDRQLKKEMRRISLLSKDIRNRATLTKNTHRLVFEIGGEVVTFKTEEAQGRVLIDDPEERLKFIKNKKDFTDSELKKYEETNPFKPVTKFSKNGSFKMLPEIMIKQIELQGIKEKFTDGEVAIYFMPEGYVELAVIQVQTKDESLKWTLVTSPLTGLMDVFDGHLDMDKVENRK